MSNLDKNEISLMGQKKMGLVMYLLSNWDHQFSLKRILETSFKTKTYAKYFRRITHSRAIKKCEISQHDMIQTFHIAKQIFCSFFKLQNVILQRLN